MITKSLLQSATLELLQPTVTSKQKFKMILISKNLTFIENGK